VFCSPMLKTEAYLATRLMLMLMLMLVVI